MKIKIYTISKKAHSCEDYGKMLNQFGVELEIVSVMNARIANAQKIATSEDSPHAITLARESYGDSLMRFISADSNNIALDSRGKELDSLGFSNIMRDSGTDTGILQRQQIPLCKCHAAILQKFLRERGIAVRPREMELRFGRTFKTLECLFQTLE